MITDVLKYYDINGSKFNVEVPFLSFKQWDFTTCTEYIGH